MEIHLPPSRGANGKSRRFSSPGLVVAYILFGVLGVCASYLFPHVARLRGNAKILAILSYGLCLLFYGFSGIAEGRSASGMFCLPVMVREDKEPNAFGYAVVSYLIIGCVMTLYGLSHVVEKLLRY